MSGFGKIVHKDASGHEVNNVGKPVSSSNSSSTSQSDNSDKLSKALSGSGSTSSSSGSTSSNGKWDWELHPDLTRSTGDSLGAQCSNAMVDGVEESMRKNGISTSSGSDDSDRKLSITPASTSTTSSTTGTIIGSSDPGPEVSYFDTIKITSSTRVVNGLTIKSTSDTSATSTTDSPSNDKNDLLTIANSNPLNREKILMDIEAGKSKDEILSTYHIKDPTGDSTPGNADSSIDNFQQGTQYDSQFLANLKALSQTEDGAKAIENSVHASLDGKVTVQLGEESFTYTPEQLNKYKNVYSRDDTDVEALELAYQDYKTKANNDGKTAQLSDYDGKDLSNLLQGGISSKTITNNYQSQSWLSRLFDPTNSNSEIKKNLNKISSDPDNYSAVATFNDSPADSSVTSGLTYVVKKVDKNNVTLSDTFDTSKETTMSVNDFIKNSKDLTVYTPFI